MSLARLSKSSTVFYEDSGPVPESDTYTTVVLVHGMLSNQKIFSKCLPYGASCNARVVTFNRHGYQASSPLPNDIHKALLEGRRSAWEYLAKDTAEFLYWLVRNKNIPKSNAHLASGGLVLVGWSMAVATLLSLLAHKDALSPHIKSTLNDYLRAVVVYDPPNYTLGRETVDGYNPLIDSELTSEQQRNRAFKHWVSSYYDHPNFASHSTDGLDRATKLGRNPTIPRMSTEESQSIFDKVGMVHADLALTFSLSTAVLKSQADLALFNESVAQDHFPRAKIIWLAATAGPWISASMYFAIRTEYMSRVKNGEKLRSIQFHEVTGANHYLHWDDPSRFMDVIVRASSI